jgi:hypothetical protein
MAWQITRLNPAVPNARQHQSSGEGQDQPPTQNKTPKSAHSRLFLGQIRRASLRDILSASAFVLSSNLADIVLLLPFRPVFSRSPIPQNTVSFNGFPVCVLEDAKTIPSRKHFAGTLRRWLYGNYSQH